MNKTMWEIAIPYAIKFGIEAAIGLVEAIAKNPEPTAQEVLLVLRKAQTRNLQDDLDAEAARRGVLPVKLEDILK